MKDANTTELLKSLEALYLDGKGESAVQLLLENRDRLEPGLFHYNLGTFYTQLNDLGAGRYHLEKALQYEGPTTDILNNLRTVQTQLAHQELAHSPQLSDRLLANLFELPMDYAITATLIMILLGMIIFKWRGIKSFWALGFYFLLSLTPVALTSYVSYQYDVAIVLKESSVLEGPSALFKEKYRLSSGLKIVVEEHKDRGWYFIKKPVHLSGWIEKKSLGLL